MRPLKRIQENVGKIGPGGYDTILGEDGEKSYPTARFGDFPAEHLLFAFLP
jgi:hypothetical protein